MDLAWGGHRNGRIPASELAVAINYRPLPGEPVGPLANRLRVDAAHQWAVMDSHYFGTTGRHLTLSEGYRDYDDQLARRRTFDRVGRPLAAVPGHSLHGWGLSADAGTEGRSWLHRNAVRFGWHPTGLDFEPPEGWHLDYLGGGDLTTLLTVPTTSDRIDNRERELADMADKIIVRNSTNGDMALVGLEGGGYVTIRNAAHYLELANAFNTAGVLLTCIRGRVTFPPELPQLGPGTHYQNLSNNGYLELLTAYTPR